MTGSSADARAESGHALVMDGMYERHRHLYDLTRPFFLFGRNQLIAGLRPPPGGTILEVGCGTARNLIRAARLHPGCRLHGVDVSEAMLKTARGSVARNGLSDRIVLRQGDAGELDVADLFGLPKMDRIMFSYTLSMMPPWKQALRRAAASLAPGGSLHVVDFGQYDGLPATLRKLHFDLIARHHVHPREDLREALQDIAAERDLSMEFSSILRGYAWTAILKDRRDRRRADRI